MFSWPTFLGSNGKIFSSKRYLFGHQFLPFECGKLKWEVIPSGCGVWWTSKVTQLEIYEILSFSFLCFVWHTICSGTLPSSHHMLHKSTLPTTLFPKLEKKSSVIFLAHSPHLTKRHTWKMHFWMSKYIKQGVCHTAALPFTLKSTLRQKKSYGNSNISPCKNIIFKKSSKRNQNPSR
jgi:hypothetical protein